MSSAQESAIKGLNYCSGSRVQGYTSLLIFCFLLDPTCLTLEILNWLNWNSRFISLSFLFLHGLEISKSFQVVYNALKISQVLFFKFTAVNKFSRATHKGTYVHGWALPNVCLQFVIAWYLMFVTLFT